MREPRFNHTRKALRERQGARGGKVPLCTALRTPVEGSLCGGGHKLEHLQRSLHDTETVTLFSQLSSPPSGHTF